MSSCFNNFDNKLGFSRNYKLKCSCFNNNLIKMHLLGLVLLLIYCSLIPTESDGSLNSDCNLMEHTLNTFIYQRCDTNESQESKFRRNQIFILYDINPVEGFNLRRDVYIRIAVFVKNLKKYAQYNDTVLVLPPFPRLYHWKSSDIANQGQISWNHFFDLAAMKQFVTVMDFWELADLYREERQTKIDYLYKLTNFEEMFQDGKFVERFELDENCDKHKNGIDIRNYFGYRNVTIEKTACLKFQGSAMVLKNFLDDNVPKNRNIPYNILFTNAETVLHDYWGNDEYWQARRSMRFNRNLVEIANRFRLLKFNSTDELDLVQRPKQWVHEKPYRNAKGGEYLCAHLRRGDFLYGREKTTPTLLSAAKQIKTRLKQFNLSTIFISSDCSKGEFRDLKQQLVRYKVVRYTPETISQKQRLKDGGIAIIDQIICSHARYFIGTYESTFTYRIYEEREILGFPKERTFNSFCKYEDDVCEKNSVWPIEF